jgi:putative Mn2+ efflux pump MntP
MKEFDDWIDHDIISAQMIDLEMKILSKNYRHRRFIETCVFLCVSISVMVMLVMVCVQMVGIFIALQLICAGCITFVANKFQQAVKAVKA